MADGKVVIDVKLDDKGVKSDAKIIEEILQKLGTNAGQSMDDNFKKHSNEMTRQAKQTSSEVNNQFKNPIEQRLELRDNLSHVAKNAFDELDRRTEGSREHLSRLKDIFEGTLAANLVESGIEGIKDGFTELIKTGVEYNATQDKMKATWTTLTDSSAKGQQMVDMVNNFQRSTGYATETLDEMEQKIYHIKGSVDETQTMTKAFTTLGDAMGLSNDKLVGVSEQFSQMMSTGKAYSGDLNIMTNAFPAFGDALVKHTGKSMGEIRKLASNGQLSAQVVEDTLVDMSKKYASATENTMNTTQGLWRTMQSNWGRLAGDFAKPIFDMKKSGFKDLEDWLGSKKADDFFTNMGTKVADAVGKITDFIKYLNDHRDTIIKFGTAFGVLALNIIAVKKVSSIVSDIDTILLGLGRLRTGYGETALASTRMADTAVANTDRMALAQEGESIPAGRIPSRGAPTASRAGSVAKGIGAVGTIGTVVGTGMVMFGDKTEKIIGTVLMFSNVILDMGKVLFNAGRAIVSFGGMLLNLGKTALTSEMLIEALSGPIGWIALAITALGLAFWAAYEKIKPFHDWVNKTASALKDNFWKAINYVKDIHKPLIDTTTNWGDTVDKTTAKALDAYTKLSDQATKKLEDLVVTGQKVADQDVPSLVAPYKQMAEQIKKHFDDTQNNAEKALDGIKKTNKKEYDDIMKQTKDANDSRKSTVDAAEGAIEAIYKKAAKEHRSITSDEQQKINDLQDTMNQKAVASMTKSQKEQEMILGKLRDHTGKITADQASEIVKNAKKQEDETIKSADKTYKESVKSANDKYKGVKDWADQEYYVNHSISKQQYDDIVGNAKDTRDVAITAAKKKRDDVTQHAKDEFDQTVDYAKKQAGGYIDQIDWQTGRVLTQWDNLKSGTLNVINDILGFFGLPKIGGSSQPSVSTAIQNERSASVSQLHGGGGHNVSAYASGTEGHQGGLALVGDGIGSNAGSEAIITPDGQLSFSPAKPTLMNLPTGTSVLSATKTRQLFSDVPHYANGIGGMASHFIEWIMQSPKYLMTKAFDAFGLNNIGSGLNSLGTTFGKMGNGAVNLALNKAIDWAKSKFSDWTGGTGYLSNIANVPGTLKNWVAEAMSIGNIPASWMSGLMTIAMHESGGNPNSVNRWDSNALAGHPSEGLMQMIGSTFASNAFAGHNNILNPIDSILSAYNYIRNRYGNINNVPGIHSLNSGGSYVGYANGTNNSTSGNVVVGENEPEFIQTPDGRIVLATQPTSFNDFMGGSQVTPLSKIPHYASGVMAKAKSVINGVGNPIASLSRSLVGGSNDTVIQIQIQPNDVNLIVNDQVIAKVVTDTQTFNNTINSRLRGEV